MLQSSVHEVRSAMHGSRVERLESGETRYRVHAHPVKRGERPLCILRDHKLGLIVHGPDACLACAARCTALSTPADVLVNAPPRGQLSFMARDDELIVEYC